MDALSLDDKIRTLAGNIRLLVLDVDGVLTDGKLYFSAAGEETKVFNSLDGLGLKLLQKSGVGVALISGRQSSIVAERAAALGITHVFQGRDDKRNVLDALLASLGFDYSVVAYAGDDLPDLSCIKLVRLGISVPDAHFSVKTAADVITTRRGGEGAVREICDWIMAAQGKLDATIGPFR